MGAAISEPSNQAQVPPTLNEELETCVCYWLSPSVSELAAHLPKLKSSVDSPSS